MSIPYKSFCWNFGTTSFRTKQFNLAIERQLELLEEFWASNNGDWAANEPLQEKYYDFLKANNFTTGNIVGLKKKAKDAREKTSGMEELGLIFANRRLTPVGKHLLSLSRANEFKIDNIFQVPSDSYVYFKQLLKTTNNIEGETVRPFVVLLYALAKLDYLTMEEFTYILPLCTNKQFTINLVDSIPNLRKAKFDVNHLILSKLLSMSNYQEALELIKNNTVTEALLCEVGLNRKSRTYDKPYYKLYNCLYEVFVKHDYDSLGDVYEATKEVKIGGLWRTYLFNTTSVTKIDRYGRSCLNKTLFDTVKSEDTFKITFFFIMHIMKAKATLGDYLDLNRRYVRTTNMMLFADGTVKLDTVPHAYFKTISNELLELAFKQSSNLSDNCSIGDIDNCFVTEEENVVEIINNELGLGISSLGEVADYLEDERYKRLQKLIDTKFTDDKLLTLLDDFETRNDKEIFEMTTDESDVPTIFEYVLGLIWYKASGRQGKILDYMKLSLDADLLPKTHAAGGESDIVYEYEKTNAYPKHCLLLEATLATGTGQRRMEMEPVSRHLGQHLIRTDNLNSYCVFATNDLNINVISDFRSRKTTPFYDTTDYTKYVEGMKIIPLATSDLKEIITNGIKYKDMYPIFEEAYKSMLPPHIWYNTMVATKLSSMQA